MTITPLEPQYTQRGGSVDLVGDELLERIREAITNHPRSQQIRIGPSEIGEPCARRIAYKLLGYEEPAREAAWKPTVGTAIHAWLEEVFASDNRKWEAAQHGHGRWYTEQTVDVGELAGETITGSCDLYDRVTGTVIDWKTIGPTQLKKYKSKGPGAQYRTQAHLYGRGWLRAGHPVDTVMIVFLPRDGELRDALIWHEPFDEQVAITALQRLEGIKLTVDTLGDKALEVLETADSYCSFCPFYKANSTNLKQGCPGDASRAVRPAAQPFSDLLAG